MNGNPLVRSITDAISPYIGQMMARSSIELHCKRLGLAAEKLEPKDVDPLLHQLALGLNIFIGREKTELVIRDIRSALGRATA